MATPSQQVEWLSLVETSGPFLTLPVLEQAFPQGLESIETPRRQLLRAAYYEWRDAVDEDDDLLPQLHEAWVNLVLTELLEFDVESATPGSAWPGELPSVTSPDGTARFTPSWIIHSPGSTQPRSFISVVRPEAPLDSAANADGWIANEIERMTLLCRAHGVRVGIVTNGESWVLLNAPTDSPSGQTTWHARYWFQEPTTLKAFQSLLGVRRCFGPTAETLEALLDESLKHQEEVTDTLGEQVRRATEVLIQALDKADEDRNRELLDDVAPALLYEASLTVMMRLVFTLCAEERGLFLLGDAVYDQHLAISTLRGQLAEDADQFGDEVLERRFDAWARILAAFRAVYAGIEHEDMRLPAMGGSLFDPDRYPFLEGRGLDTSWLDTPARPLPIDNRTVLLLLNSLQVLESSRGALALSYRALDVEQVGHVYEGLLDHTVVRVAEDTLGLRGSSKARYPAIPLSDLESARFAGTEALVARVVDVTGRPAASVRSDLSRPASEPVLARIHSAIHGDQALAARVDPFANLVRNDAWGSAIIYRAQSFVVTAGTDRKESGTHYTPRSLTEQIVHHSLEPLVYRGPGEGRPRTDWALKSPAELLNIKVCDPAMGSGAFLVQACRYLAERLVEAWSECGAVGKFITTEGEVLDELGDADPIPASQDERIIIARRLVAERGIYGVDINPLAVELAKLSIWLVTLSKAQPFTFLDHCLKSGDSLVGVRSTQSIAQLQVGAVTRSTQETIFGQALEETVERAIALRMQLMATNIRDVSDVSEMAAINAKAHDCLANARLIADRLVGQQLEASGNSRTLRRGLSALEIEAEIVTHGDSAARGRLERETTQALTLGGSGEKRVRPFHWSLEFPEVLNGAHSGFDAVIGNPPWASFSGRQAVPLEPALDKYWAEEFAVFSGWKTLHSLFVEQFARLASTDGSIGVLLPAPVADLDGYAPVRRFIRAAKYVREPLLYFGEEAFAGVVQPSCALIAVGNPPPSGKPDGAPFILGASGLPTTGPNESDFHRAIQQLNDRGRPPADAFADPGVHTGNCSKKIVLTQAGSVGEFAHVREGRSVFAYRLEAPQKWLHIDYQAADGEYFTIRDLSVYQGFPILLRQTAKRPIAAAHDSPTYFRNSVLACRGISGVSTPLVLAWLNSTAVGAWHMTKVREANQGAFPQVKVRHLRDLPVPDWSVLAESIGGQAPALVRSAGGQDATAIATLDEAVSHALGLSTAQHAAIVSGLAAMLGETSGA